MSKLELWGGHECSLNRIGDRFSDQTVLSGHESRMDDLERFAALGITTLRYPALWERIEAEPGVRSFTWLDARLARLAELRMRPVLTLVHHGSGPKWTSLVDEGFASGLARHAAAVARRYPAVEAYTPVNEPLTTARFSTLYGHWYPHARDPALFWRALLQQIDATRLSMRAIRQVNSDARLVQTEDLGLCQATPALFDQADFENTRRWLTWDLLCGAVTPDHPLHAHIAGYGFGDALARIADDPCPPDVIGINHYVTSDRFLDDAVERYPPERIGGNGRRSYADVEAVRVSAHGHAGFAVLLEQAWKRFGLPLAITECHLGCTHEEQMRWFLEAWRAAERVKATGVDVLAVTAWSLLGAFGWSSLLETTTDYESGVYDVGEGAPRPTALADLLARISRGEPAPKLARGEGWWRRDEVRLVYDGHAAPTSAGASADPGEEGRVPPLVITGAAGEARVRFVEACWLRGLPCMIVEGDRSASSEGHVVDAGLRLDEACPWAVLELVDRSEGRAQLSSWSVACDSRHVECMRLGVDDLAEETDAQENGPALHSECAVVAAGLMRQDPVHAVLDRLIDRASTRTPHLPAHAERVRAYS